MTIKTIDKKAKERYQNLCKEIARYSTINPLEKLEDKKIRIVEGKANFNFFVSHYFAHYASESETPEFHTEIAEMVAKNTSIKVWLQWARMHAKSVIATILLPLWLWIRGDLDFLLVIGQNEDKAKILTGDIQAEFEHNERLIHDFGHQQLFGSWENGFFQTKNGLIVKAFGMGQDPRGIRVGPRRPDMIVCDDWETRQTVKNEQRQDEMADWLLTAVIPAMGARNRRVLLAQNKWHPRMIFSKIIEENEAWIVHKVNAYDPVTYEPTWKSRFTAEFWIQIEAEIGKIKANAEYNNDPHVEGKLFIDDYFNYGPLPRLNTFDWIIGRWDVAFAGTSTSDFNAVRIWGLKDGKKWLIDCFVKQCKVKIALQWIADYQKNLPKSVKVQVGFEAQFWNEEIYRNIDEIQKEWEIYLNLIKIDRRSCSKYDDIVSTLPQYQNGRIYYNEKLKSSQDFQVGLVQLKGIEPGYTSNDDAPDADTYAINDLDTYQSAKKRTHRTGNKREDRKF